MTGQFSEDDIGLLDAHQFRSIYLWLPPHIHQPVHLPIDVGELRDDITLDGRIAADVLDFMFEREELMPLAFLCECIKRTEYAVQAIPLETVEDTGRPRNLASLKIAAVPPRPFARWLGQPPISELGNDQRFVASWLRISERAEDPFGAGSKVRAPVVPLVSMVGNGIVLMKISEISFDVEVLTASAVVIDHTAEWRRELLGALEGGAQPAPFILLLEVGAPRFVNDALNHNGRMVPVAVHHLREGFLSALGRQRSEMICVIPRGNLIPHEHPHFVRGPQI